MSSVPWAVLAITSVESDFISVFSAFFFLYMFLFEISSYNAHAEIVFLNIWNICLYVCIRIFDLFIFYHFATKPQINR